MAERKCSAAQRAGRAEKARQFRFAAQIIEEYAGSDDELNDAYVTLCVHAAIAGADVICCARLGVHHEGSDHQAAVELLARVSPDLSRDLETLLALETPSGYSARGTSAAARKRARRAMNRLVDEAQAAHTG